MVAVALLLNILNGYGLTIMAVVGPAMIAAGVGTAADIAAASAWGLTGMAAGSLLLAQVADGAGRRPVAIIAALAIALGLLLPMVGCTVTFPVSALILSRLLAGLGIGILLPLTDVIAAEAAPDGRRPLAVAIMLTGYGIGALSAMLGGPALGAVHWGAGLAAGAGAALIAALLAAQVLASPAPHPRHRVPLVTVLTSRAILSVAGMALIYALHVATLGYVLGTLPRLMVQAGASAAMAQGAALAGNLAGIAGGLTLGWLAMRMPVRHLLIAVMLGGGAAAALFGLSAAHPPLLAGLLILSFALVQSAMVGLYVMMATLFPASIRVTGVGLVLGCGRMGSVIAAALAGRLAAAHMDGGAIVAIVALGTIAGALLVRLLPLRAAA